MAIALTCAVRFAGCPAGYSNLAGSTRCYRISAEEASWWRARQVCEGEGGDLLSLQSALEEYLITHHLSQNKGPTHHLYTFTVFLLYYLL